jgi:hypothetical protein
MNFGRVSRVVAGGLLGLSLTLGAASASAQSKPTPKEQKISTYVDMINKSSNYLFENYDRYSKRVVDLKKGPTCKELGPQSWISGMGPSSPERYAGYRKALAKQPKLASDAAALEMLEALEALYKPENEASEYFFQSKFKQDNCKRGGELHAVLMANWTKYMRAEQVVRAFLDKYGDERDTTELDKAQKKYGKALHYYHQKIMIDAKALIRVANDKQFDVEAVRARAAAFAPTLAEAKAIVEKEKKGKNAEALYQGGYEQMLYYAGNLQQSVNEVLRVVDEEAKDPKAAARTNARPQAMKNMITAYNGLVDQSNKTLYSKNMK